MPPLTEEFIKGLKDDLRNNPIEIEQAHSTLAHGDNNSSENQWRNWQHNFDKSCMEWKTPMDFVARLEMAVRNGSKFPDHPVFVKGTSCQQMGILLAVWYTDPELLLHYYKVLLAGIMTAKEEGQTGHNLNMICDNRDQIRSILEFAGCSHLESGALEILDGIEEKINKGNSVNYKKIVCDWWAFLPEHVVEKARRDRVKEFLLTLTFHLEDDHVGIIYIPLPEFEPDFSAFISDMWEQHAKDTVSYAEALYKTTDLETLRGLDVLETIKNQLRSSWLVISRYFQNVDLSGLDSYYQQKVDALFASSQTPSEKTDRNYSENETDETGKTPEMCTSENKIIGSNGGVLKWNDEFSIVWLNNKKVILQTTKRKPTIQRAVIKLVEWHKEGILDADLIELFKAIDSGGDRFDKLFGNYTNTRCLIVRVPESRWRVRLNI